MEILIIGGGLQALSVASSLKKRGILLLHYYIKAIFQQNQDI